MTSRILPAPSPPGGLYTPVVIHAGIAYVSGQLPRRDGSLAYRGKLGAELDIEAGRVAARLCGLQALAALDAALGGTQRILRLLKLTGFVASAPGFVQQPAVVDGASEVLIEILGEAGAHARSAVGVAELPHGAPVEVEIVAAIIAASAADSGGSGRV